MRIPLQKQAQSTTGAHLGCQSISVVVPQGKAAGKYGSHEGTRSGLCRSQFLF